MFIPAQFNQISEIKKLFPKDLPIVGVGVTAYPRSAWGYLLPNYQILSLLETADLAAIRQICPVVSVEKTLSGELPEKFNTSSILTLPQVKKWLINFRPQPVRRAQSLATPLDVPSGVSPDILRASVADGRIGLFVYKDSEAIDRMAQELGVKILGTPGKIRKVFENKKFFREGLVKAGLKPIQGCSLKVEELDEKRWDRCKSEFGERLVFQLTDYTVGGGLGTFFINSKADFKNFQEFVRRRREVRQELNKVIEWVNVTKFIEGEAASILGCATKFGTVTGVLQKQIIDQPELAALAGRSGVWLGHDWNVRFSPEAQAEGEKLCQQWGDYLYQQGYKGMFGLDLVVCPSTLPRQARDRSGSIVPIECNSRYTGAFPMYTMMQINNKEMPLDVWHLLEWLDVDYEMDIETVQKLGRGEKKGAQLLLHNLERKTVTATKTVKAGVYRIAPQHVRRAQSFATTLDVSSGVSPDILRASVADGAIQWLHPGFSILDIKDKNEFVLCDRVAGEESVLKPAERLGRLVFKRQVVDKKGLPAQAGSLLPEIREVVRAVYDSFELMPLGDII